jgi:hypothetical protein
MRSLSTRQENRYQIDSTTKRAGGGGGEQGGASEKDGGWVKGREKEQGWNAHEGQTKQNKRENKQKKIGDKDNE